MDITANPYQSNGGYEIYNQQAADKPKHITAIGKQPLTLYHLGLEYPAEAEAETPKCVSGEVRTQRISAEVLQ